MNDAGLQVIHGGRYTPPGPAVTDPVELQLSIDLDAEAAILGNVIHDETLLDLIRPWFRVEHMYSEAHQRIFEACCAVRDACKPLDLVTVATQLRDTDRLGQAGGMPYLTTVQNAAPALSAARVTAYATGVRDKWVRREVRDLCTASTVQAKTEATPIEKLIEAARTRLDELTVEMGATDKDASVSEILKRTLARLMAMKSTGGKGDLPSGFDRLDVLLGGLTPTLMVVGARPGMGKTSFATRIAVNVAGRRNDAGELANGVYMASMETFDEEAMTRLWCAESRVSVTAARTGMLTKLHWDQLTGSASYINSLPMWIDDESAQTVDGLWSKCRRADMLLKRKGKKLRLVVVDYLQLLRAPRAKISREEAVSENTRKLLAMANDLKCCVLALAQLNRKCEERPDKRPQLADLREAGEIEAAARVVAFIYRDEYYKKDSEDRNIAEIIVAKQNNGATGTVRVRFDGMCTRFDNLAEGYDDEPTAAASSFAPPPGRFDDGPDEPTDTALPSAAVSIQPPAPPMQQVPLIEDPIDEGDDA